MGGEAWSHFTPFEKSVRTAIEKLLDQVFDSGQFRGSEMDPATRTTEPTHEMVVANREFFDRIEREQGI